MTHTSTLTANPNFPTSFNKFIKRVNEIKFIKQGYSAAQIQEIFEWAALCSTKLKNSESGAGSFDEYEQEQKNDPRQKWQFVPYLRGDRLILNIRRGA